MTVTMFISILTIGSLVSSLLTEAIKKWYENANKQYSANTIALVDAIVIGAGGTACVYMLTGTEWTVNNVICLILMAIAVWMGSMVGYDKLLQLVKQIADLRPVENKKK